MGLPDTTQEFPDIAFAPRELWRDAVGGNQVVTLEEQVGLWVVVAGGADVFAVLPGEEKAQGQRRFLFRVEAGGLVLGMSCGDCDADVGLVAVPTAEGRLVRLDPSVMEPSADAAHREALGGAIDVWLTALDQAVVESMPPPGAEQAQAGEPLAVESGGAVVGHGAFVWGIASPRSLSLEAKVVLRDETEACAVPIPPHGWFAVNQALELTPYTTAEGLKDARIFKGIRLFHNVLLRRLQDREVSWAEEETERLQYASAFDAGLVDRSLRHLENVLERKSLQVSLASGQLRGLPLVAAFETVARANNIDIGETRGARELETHRDPVSALARAARVATRRVELVGEWWRLDGGPLLGFLEGKRAVALLPTSPKSYDVFDPTDGSRRPVDASVAAELSDNAYVLYRSFAAAVVRVGDLLRLGMGGSGADLFVAMAAGFFAGLLALIVPMATSIVLDDVIPNAERSQLLQYTLLLIAAAISVTFFSYSELISLLRIRGKMDNRLQSAVWERLLGLPVSFFRQFNAGDLALRAMGINSIGSTLATATLHSIFSGIFSVFSLGLMIWYSWKLAILGVVLVFLATIVGLLIIRVQLKYQRPLHMKTGAIAGQVLQIIGGIAKLRVAGAEGRAFSAWAESFAEQKLLTRKARSRANAFMVFSRAFTLFSTAIILVGIAFLARDMEVGSFAAFHAAYAQFAGGAMGLLMAVNSTISIIPLYERARPILDTIPEVVPRAGDPGDLRGRIELDQVCFRYDPTGEMILNHVSLGVEEGEFLAIVGASGSGKSTLFRLLLGFETPETGTIAFDRRNIAGLDLGALRRQIGVVLQDGKLMPGTIFENIVGSSTLTEDDAWEAARLSGLDTFIKGLPMGMHTFVSEGAATFSGGQRQRLMIARAIVKRPRILLFDEATSALDNQTQGVVSEAVGQLRATRIVIAHRLSTVVQADRIVVLDHGRLVQSGTYQGLLAEDGPFAELARRQIA